MSNSWDCYDVDFTHSHEVQDARYFFIIDHFFWIVEFSEQVEEAGVIHSPDNSSDRSPIFCVVKVEPDLVNKTNVPSAKRKPCWARANQEEKDVFKTSL